MNTTENSEITRLTDDDFNRTLQSKDWTAFAKCYNGPAYAQNRYDVKLEAAYRKIRGEFFYRFFSTPYLYVQI